MKHRMAPRELIFCVHPLTTVDHGENFDVTEDAYKDLNIITFCPLVYWEDNRHLPDYYFADCIEDSLLPEGYSWYVFVEETQWASKKSKEEIVADLTKIGFAENKDLERFLINCWT